MVAWMIAVTAAFVLAMRLDPDGRGYGTHQQLGLPPCTFQFLWQIPCPSCGGTTAFSFFVRGQWSSAASANIGAFFLAIVSALSIPWCAVSVWQGRSWKLRDPFWISLLLMITFVGLTVIQWIVRLVALRSS